VNDVDCGQSGSLDFSKVAAPETWTVKNLLKVLLKLHEKEEVKEKTVRLWRPTQQKDYFSYLRKMAKANCDDSTGFTVEYHIPLEGDFLSGSEGKTLKEVGVTDGELLVLEHRVGEFGVPGNWFFKHNDVPEEANCEFCNKLTVLLYTCTAQTSQWCSEKCYQDDLKYHIKKCVGCRLIKKSDIKKPAQPAVSPPKNPGMPTPS
jgi:hypothetical protein